MIERQVQGIQFVIDPRIELIMGLQTVLCKQDPSLTEELDWVEVPNTKYGKELCDLLDFKQYSELHDYVRRGIGEYADIVYLAFAFDEDFNLTDDSIMTASSNCFQDKQDIQRFGLLVKQFVEQSHFMDFFHSYQKEFDKIFDDVIELPAQFDVSDLEQFYGYPRENPTIIFTTLCNGGFGLTDKNRLVCIKGVEFDQGKYEDPTDFLVNLFHEYSHPYVNPLCEEYFSSFQHVNCLLEESIQNGLHACYHKEFVVLDEYIVRANSYVLASKYRDCQNSIDWWEQSGGFVHLSEVVDFISKERPNYSDFESLFVQKVIPYFNTLTKQKTKKK